MAALLVAELERELDAWHALRGRALQAIARCSGCDDVIFRLAEDDAFAIVHLTWSGRLEPAPFPRTTLLPTFMALELVAEAHRH
jgi:hypothetical protein